MNEPTKTKAQAIEPVRLFIYNRQRANGRTRDEAASAASYAMGTPGDGR